MPTPEDLSQQVKPLLDGRLELLRIQGSQVILSVKEQMSTRDRGILLLDTERMLRREISQRIEIFLEPKGDLSKLRQRLRGVTLNGSRDEVFLQTYGAAKPLKNGGSDKSDSK